MDFGFPFFDFIVLPVGAVTGRRIVIDGVNGTIEFYDENDELRIRQGGPGGASDAITLFTGDPDEDNGGFLDSFETFVAPQANRQLAVRLESPSFDIVGSRDRARVIVVSEAADASEPEQVALNARLVRQTPDDLLSQTCREIGRASCRERV